MGAGPRIATRWSTWVLVAVLAVLVLAVGADAALAVDNTFNGTTNSDWNTGTNWSQGHAPLSSEDVLITVSGKNPSLSTDGQAKSITTANSNNLTVTGHTLTVGSGTSALDGTLLIGSGGIVSLAGATSVTHVGGGVPAIAWNGTGGRLDIASGGTLDLAADAVRLQDGGTSSLVHVLSGGTLKLSVGGTEGAQVDTPLDNDGGVLATAGRLLLRGGTGGQTSSGTYTATSPATVAYQGTTDLSTTARLTGTGTMEFNGGTLTIPANSTASPSAYNPANTSFTLGGLSLGSDGSTGTLASTGGERGGAGTLTVSGAATHTGFGLNFSGGTTNLNGSTTIHSGMSVTGSTLTLNANAALDTAGASGIVVAGGTVNVGSAGTLDMSANDVNVLNGGGSPSLHVLAGGTLKRTAAGVNGQVGIPATNAGTVRVDAGTLLFSGGLTQTGGVTDVKANTLNGTVNLQGGTLKGTGTLGGPVDNTGGTVAPGASPGLLTVTGNYTQGPGGTLQEEITGTALSAFDRLAVGGAVSLDGTLAIQSATFTPSSTDTFKIIGGASSRTGTFASLTGATVNGATYSPQYDADGVTLTSGGPPPPPPPPPPPAPPSNTSPSIPSPASPAPPAVPPSADVAAAAATPACLSIPAVVRDQVAPLRRGGRVLLLTRQVDDPARPLLASVRFAGRGAIRSVAFSANGRALSPGAKRLTAVVPIGALRIGRGRNRVVAKVTMADGRRATVTQFFEVERCPLPPVACTRLSDGRSLRCTGGTPLRARKVKVTVTRSAAQTARGSATVTRGHYTVVVRSSATLPPGRYAFKYVATTSRRGQSFQVLRIVNVV
jgi:hypothetical protein